MAAEVACGCGVKLAEEERKDIPMVSLGAL
jgi:hypothetical protein